MIGSKNRAPSRDCSAQLRAWQWYGVIATVVGLAALAWMGSSLSTVVDAHSECAALLQRAANP